MKKYFWLILFLAILAANLADRQFNNGQLEYYFKPLLIAVLAVYFISQTSRVATNLKKWILLALFFSWAGDVLLMFEPKDKMFFLLGLSSFLLAHIFYIVFFHFVRVGERVKGNPWLLVVVVIYYAILINFLSPYLAEMKIPVLVYGIVISFMFMLAMHMLFIKNNAAGKWMMFGALLFVVSDSVLAINKFYQSFEAAGILIMLTYGLAQLFIVEGAVKYIRGANRE
ncbi:MAG TPA: lysoplasmalogenase [Chitinophagaceae bacterium]|nr:lysoplasmalogenase [Chitinophagaceae bacterium]